MSAKLHVLILWLALYEKHHINMGCNLSHYTVMQSCVTQNVTKNMCIYMACCIVECYRHCSESISYYSYIVEMRLAGFTSSFKY
jgi:hypothetical protein